MSYSYPAERIWLANVKFNDFNIYFHHQGAENCFTEFVSLAPLEVERQLTSCRAFCTVSCTHTQHIQCTHNFCLSLALKHTYPTLHHITMSKAKKKRNQLSVVKQRKSTHNSTSVWVGVCLPAVQALRAKRNINQNLLNGRSDANVWLPFSLLFRSGSRPD